MSPGFKCNVELIRMNDEILHNDTLNKTFYLKSVLWERRVTNFYLLYLRIKSSQIIPCTSNNSRISEILWHWELPLPLQNLYLEIITGKDIFLEAGNITAFKQSCWKVIFSLMYVCSWGMGGGGCLCGYYPWCMDLTVRGHELSQPAMAQPSPSPRNQTWDPRGPSPIPRTSDMGPHATDIWWLSLETCSNLFSWEPIQTSTGIWWLKHVRLASRQYTSCWNALLLSTVISHELICRR